MALLTLFKRTTGLNTAVDPKRLPKDFDTASTGLGVAVNISIDPSGMVGQGEGFSSVKVVEEGHSLFCHRNSPCVLGVGGSIFQVSTEYASLQRVSGLSGRRISYAEVGGELFYANGDQVGRLSPDARSWDVGEYWHADSSKHYESSIPKFEKVAYCNGKIIGAIGNSIYESEPSQFGLFNGKKVTSLGSKVTMITPVNGGIFASDLTDTYFLEGPGFPYNIRRVATYPALEWAESIDRIDGDDIGLENVGLCAVWFSKKGMCLGADNGYFKNLTRKRIIVPEGVYGASLIKGYNLLSTVDEDFTLGMNLDGFAGYQKTDHSFNSYCRFGDKFLALSGTNLCELGGDTHNGTNINSYFEPFTTDFGYVGEKRLHYVYLTVEGSGNISVTATPDEKTGYTSTKTLHGTGLQKIRFEFPRSLQGVYIKFRITKNDGNYYNVDKMQALVDRLPVALRTT